MSYLLEARQLYKNYGSKVALQDVNLNIPEGSIFGLLGPNGAGKTTLIRIINQITYPDQGQVLFDGVPLQAEHISRIGYLPEERGLYKNMKVGEQALYLAQLKGMSRDEAQKSLKYWFEKLEIGDWWNRKVQELSKGMAQKVQFVVTILHNPRLLIFDEPFSGFDPINANLIKEEILELNRKGATVIFSTHRMESVEELCDHIALIHKSRKVLDGSLNEIKRAFRGNIFEVGLHTANPGELRKVLEDRYQVEEARFKSLDHDLKLRIRLEPDMTSEHLLEDLKSKARLSHFSEVIPTANDIFIQTVNGLGI